jgi:diaminopimelate decarboxylase
MTQTFPVDQFACLRTPFYYYDTNILRQTLQAITDETQANPDIHVHYAVKANANPQLLSIIREYGLGADCVSGGEIERALMAGFPADKIVFAGVGKSDWEIALAIDRGIFCFNVESLAELEVINQIAAQKGRTAPICFRINPNVGAHTHAHITTGLAENKFGIDIAEALPVIRRAQALPAVRYMGLHFHIGSQILQMDDFAALAHRINTLQDQLEAEGIKSEVINVGGGLGVDYTDPLAHPIPDFKSYFDTYRQSLRLRPDQKLCFELGRSVTAQCGALITRVNYLKRSPSGKGFVIVDAGMTELIRPALYGAHHKILNLSSTLPAEPYDVVGPICESSDVFDKSIMLPQTRRGDLLAILSAGAYGEIMASQYNCRPLPQSFVR